MLKKRNFKKRERIKLMTDDLEKIEQTEKQIQKRKTERIKIQKEGKNDQLNFAL